MRRTAPPCLLESPPQAPSEPSTQWILELSLPLETITPVIGGGCRSKQPDPREAVRPASLRGILRHWWRVVGDETDAKTLHQKEAAFWGGVDLDKATLKEIEQAHPGRVPETLTKQAGKGKVALASRVQLLVKVDEPGTIEPTGWHDFVAGRPKTLPRWTKPELSYALFPLQRTQQELRLASNLTQVQREGRLSTGPWRTGLKFTLTLRVRALPLGEKEPDWSIDQLKRLLRAVQAWLLLGGYGARTTRGFGALAIQKNKHPEATLAGNISHRNKDELNALCNALAPSDAPALIKQLEALVTLHPQPCCSKLALLPQPSGAAAHGGHR